jgi:cytoskeletal protein RodZ
MRLMESVGKYLKAERESQNLSLQEVSESTKIRELLLKALEEDRYDLISSPVYVKGFLDAYARYLGLDSNEIILQYQKNYAKKTPLKGPGLEQRKTSPSLERKVTFSKKRVTLWLFIIATSVMLLLIGMVIYRISLKPRHGSPRLSEEESAPIPVPPVPSPPPIQEEADTQITEPPKKVETPQQMGSKKNRGGKIPGKSGLRKKSERDKQNGEQN